MQSLERRDDPACAVAMALQLEEQCYPAALRQPEKTLGRAGPGSLSLLFGFYAKIQAPGQKMTKRAPTYDDILRANRTLSLFEMIWMFRDLRVLPQYVTKRELQHLWKLTAADRSKAAPKGQTFISGLNYSEFLSFMVQVSLLAYGKAGFRRRLAAELGVRPYEVALEDMVEGFCKDMHLYDIQWVRNFLRTTSRETVGRINYRSAGESSGIGQRLVTERVISRMANTQKHDRRPEHQGSQRPVYAYDDDDDDTSGDDDDAEGSGRKGAVYNPRETKSVRFEGFSVEKRRNSRRREKEEEDRSGATFNENRETFSPGQIEALELYHREGKHLWRVLDRYSVDENNSTWREFPGAAMDCGALFREPGHARSQVYKYRLKLINMSRDALDLEVRPDDHLDRGIELVVGSPSVTPGMRSNLEILLHPDAYSVGEHYGSIFLFLSNRRHPERNLNLTVPVHFCVIASDSAAARSLIAMGSGATMDDEKDGTKKQATDPAAPVGRRRSSLLMSPREIPRLDLVDTVRNAPPAKPMTARSTYLSDSSDSDDDFLDSPESAPGGASRGPDTRRRSSLASQGQLLQQRYEMKIPDKFRPGYFKPTSPLTYRNGIHLYDAEPSSNFVAQRPGPTIVDNPTPRTVRVLHTTRPARMGTPKGPRFGPSRGHTPGVSHYGTYTLLRKPSTGHMQRLIMRSGAGQLEGMEPPAAPSPRGAETMAMGVLPTPRVDELDGAFDDIPEPTDTPRLQEDDDMEYAQPAAPPVKLLDEDDSSSDEELEKRPREFFPGRRYSRDLNITTDIFVSRARIRVNGGSRGGRRVVAEEEY